MNFRRGREFVRLDNCDDQTWRLSEWRKRLYCRVLRDEIPFALSVQTLPCEVNNNQNTPIGLQHVSSGFSVMWKLAREVSVASRVQWNNGFETARTDCSLRSWLCLGQHSLGQKHVNQRSVTEKCVQCGLMLNFWPKEGCTGKH